MANQMLKPQRGNQAAEIMRRGEVLNLKRGFDENDLYGNLFWFAENQSEIEKKLFELRRGVKILQPREQSRQSRQLLEALIIKLPEVLPRRDMRVVTRKKLPKQRKSQ